MILGCGRRIRKPVERPSFRILTTETGFYQFTLTGYLSTPMEESDFWTKIKENMNNEILQFPPIPKDDVDETDWSYTMRRDMQEILPGVYLGPYAAAMKSKLGCLKEHGITHIVCIRQAIEAHFIKPNFMEHFRYLVLDVADQTTENIIQFFPKVKQFIDNCLESGGRVLVHGNAGISRSGALVIAYIMEKYGLPYKDAFVFVQQRRFCVNPNEGFVQQLIEFEALYRARLSLQLCEKSPSPENLKRKCHFDVEDSSHMEPLNMT